MFILLTKTRLFDIAVVCDRSILSKGRIIRGAPDLIVEILSFSTAKRDRGYKKDLYERYGVKEYWIVSSTELSIEVYLLRNGKYVLDNICILPAYWELESMTDEEKEAYQFTFSPSMFEDLIVDIREIFEDID